MMTTRTAQAILKGIKNPKLNENYTARLLAYSITPEEGDWLAAQLARVADKQHEYVMVFNAGLGVIDNSLLRQKPTRFDGVYNFVSNKNDLSFIKNNLDAWKLTDATDVQYKFSPKAYNELLPASIALVMVTDNTSNDMLLETLDRLIDASFTSIAIRTDLSLYPFNYQYLKKTTTVEEFSYSGGSSSMIVFRPTESTKTLTLRYYLQSFLANFISSTDVPKYIDEKYMPTWRRAFNSEILNPNANYEDLELLGDGMLDSVILRIIFQRVNGIKAGQATELKSTLVDKSKLGALADRCGLTRYVNTFRMTKHVREDVFEAFIGALILVSDEITQGLSYVNAYNFILYAYRNETFGDAGTLPDQPSLTFVNQALQRSGLDPLNVQTEKSDKNTFVTLMLTQNAMTKLQSWGIVVNTMIIGRQYNIDPTKAKKRAYDEAFANMQKLGITSDWVKQKSQEVILSRSDIQPLFLQALQKAKLHGFDTIEIKYSNVQSDYTGQIVTVIGSDAMGNKERLSDGSGLHRHTAVQAALQKYLK